MSQIDINAFRNEVVTTATDLDVTFESLRHTKTKALVGYCPSTYGGRKHFSIRPIRPIDRGAGGRP